MALRELRAEPRRLVLLGITVAIGVAALVAVNSLGDNVRDSVRQQSRALLGADLSLSSRSPFSRRVESLLDTLSRKAELARVTSFAGMAYVTRTEGSRLVQVAAVDGRYPFYGQIQTAPRPAWAELQSGRHVIVDPSLLSALSARLGDTLALGEARFVISGTIVSAPSEVGFRFALGPKVYIPAAFVNETKLLGFGARAQYEVFLRLAAGIPPQRLVDQYRTVLRSERVTPHTVADDQRNLSDVLGRMTGYLGLVALTALLLAGVGVATAIVMLLRRRSDSIAVLRCLGASALQILAIYLLEATLMALLGSVAGACLGVALQRLLPALLSGLVPIEITPGLSLSGISLGIASGLLIAAAFALLPLLTIRWISPLEALRRRYQPVESGRDWIWLLTLGGLVVSVVLLAVHQVGSWRQGLWFSAGVAACMALLTGLGWSVTRLLRNRIPQAWSYPWRQGLANLHRPANQTLILLLAVGLGAFLLGTLYLVQQSLLRQLRVTGGPARPNLVLFDIQPDQLVGVLNQLRGRQLPAETPTPIVTMRLQAINGRAVGELLTPTNGSGEPSNAWALRREYRSTYRDTLVRTERLVSGTWWDRKASTPARISIEEDLAQELHIRVGDEILWDVQGVPLLSQVANLRSVDWARFEPNFFVVFAPGSLERAPQTYVTLTRVLDPGQRGRFQRELAERFPNISVLDLSLVQQALEKLVNRVTLAIRFMATFTLAVGVLVLTGTLASSRLQRLREAALLRTLGASRVQIFRIALAEYFSLGVIAAVPALVLASLAAWALSHFVFDATFSLPFVGLTALGLGIATLTTVVGLANSRETVRRRPLELLREE
jgi:putative ABC transport system permease protein